MTRPIIRIHDLLTDEVIDREMTTAEFKQYEADQANEAIKQAEAELRAQAKAATESKLAALGLTLDDLLSLDL